LDYCIHIFTNNVSPTKQPQADIQMTL
jgi:hypothetical protein